MTPVRSAAKIPVAWLRREEKTRSALDNSTNEPNGFVWYTQRELHSSSPLATHSAASLKTQNDSYGIRN